MRSLVVVLVGAIILSFCSFAGYAEDQGAGAGRPLPRRPPRPCRSPGGPCDGREHDR